MTGTRPQIGEANREYLRGGKKPPGAPDHQRRLQRLQEIRDELLSLTGKNHEHGVTAKLRLLV